MSCKKYMLFYFYIHIQSVMFRMENDENGSSSLMIWGSQDCLRNNQRLFKCVCIHGSCKLKHLDMWVWMCGCICMCEALSVWHGWIVIDIIYKLSICQIVSSYNSSKSNDILERIKKDKNIEIDHDNNKNEILTKHKNRTDFWFKKVSNNDITELSQKNRKH